MISRGGGRAYRVQGVGDSRPVPDGRHGGGGGGGGGSTRACRTSGAGDGSTAALPTASSSHDPSTPAVIAATAAIRANLEGSRQDIRHARSSRTPKTNRDSICTATLAGRGSRSDSHMSDSISARRRSRRAGIVPVVYNRVHPRTSRTTIRRQTSFMPGQVDVGEWARASRRAP